MHLARQAGEKYFEREGRDAPSFHPEFLALKRYSHFHAFLRDELEACRTETERKVVLSVLLTTQLRIEKLVASLNLLEETGQGAVRAS